MNSMLSNPFLRGNDGLNGYLKKLGQASYFYDYSCINFIDCKWADMIIRNEFQVFSFFSSYLNDMTYLINSVKKMVYSIINIPNIFAPVTPTYPDLNSIILNCNKSHDDLRHIQSMLKGYSSIKSKTKQSRHLWDRIDSIRQRGHSNNTSRLKQQDSIVIEVNRFKTLSTMHSQNKSTKEQQKSIFYKTQHNAKKQQVQQHNMSRMAFVKMEQQINSRTDVSQSDKNVVGKRKSMHLKKRQHDQKLKRSDEVNDGWNKRKQVKSQSKSVTLLSSLEYVRLIRDELNIGQ